MLPKQLLPQNIYSILIRQGISELRPPQLKSLQSGLFENNLFISSPTASGKTLIAEMFFCDIILNEGGKVVYLVPLRSLAREKFTEFTRKYSSLFRIGISTGELDSTDYYLNNYNLIITTSEKMDSLLRHGVGWIASIHGVIADEVHLLGDKGRGATLEIVLTQVRSIALKCRFLCLSATVKNCKELSDWLGCTLIMDDYRPVKLYEGIYYNNSVDFFEKQRIVNARELDIAFDIINECNKMEKQVLVFVSSRKRAETLALKCLKLKDLNELSNKIVNVLEKPTTQCRKLSNCVKKGIAFHHAGLVEKQKEIIETAFRNGMLRAIFATTTLAMGLNLPAFMVIVRDLKRYDTEQGYNNWIKVLEYKQLCGRAGRPGFEEFGEAVTIATSEEEKGFICNNFINGELEEIYSQLSLEPVLRTHLLSLISQGVITSENSASEFFNKTFHAFQYGNADKLNATTLRLLNDLEFWGFVKRENGALLPTKIGIRVSQLYLDPFSAQKIITSLNNSENIEIKQISLLHTASLTSELKPLLNVNVKEYTELAEEYMIDKENLLFNEPDDSQTFIKAYKTALLFNSWIEESSEEDILKKFRTSPGDMRSKTANLDWVLYSMKELSLLLNHNEIIPLITELRIRIKYGIKKELLPLVKFKGIGRTRARQLFNAGIKNTKDIKDIPLAILGDIVGKKVASDLKSQV